jgi:predicted dehydrogenase
VLICAATDSNDPIDLAGAIARDRGTVIAVGAVGLEIPRATYFNKELTFLVSRSYGPGRYDLQYEEKGQDYPIGYVRWTEGRNLAAFVELLETRRLDVRPLITHRYPVDQAPQAYDLILGKKKAPYLGVLITYPHEGDLLDPLEKPTRGDSSSSPPPRTPGDRVSVGILGAGNFAGAVLFPILAKRQDLTLTGVASASGVNAQSALKRFGFKYAASSAAQILEDPVVEAVGVLTRHHLHAEQVLAAFEAGKHVFCEKPLAINEDQLQDIEVALKGLPAEILLMVGFNRRFAPLARQLKAFLADRREPLMAHYRVNAGYLPLDHWLHDPEIGGGRIVGEGCHFVDFLAFLVGQSPASVTALALPDAGRYRQDNVLLTFNFPDGSIGSVSYLANGDKSFAKERVEVFTEGRVAVMDDFRTLELVEDGKRRSTKARFRQDKGHGAAWEAFLTAIQNRGGPPIPYDQLFGVTRATFAAVEALQTGKVVDL